MKSVPRGIRNNNPFNLVLGPDKWQGLSAEQNDPQFCTFDSPVLGIRAGMRDLIAAQDKHSLRTVNGIISRFAPAASNNTAAYIEGVCAHMGVDSSALLDMHNYNDLRSLAEAIIEHENGQPWNTWYSEAQLVKACVMAGVEAPRRSLAISRQMIGSGIAAAATVATPVLQSVQEQLQPLLDYSEWIKRTFLVVTLLGIVLAMWAKIDERRKGIS